MKYYFVHFLFSYGITNSDATAFISYNRPLEKDKIIEWTKGLYGWKQTIVTIDTIIVFTDLEQALKYNHEHFILPLNSKQRGPAPIN